MGTLDSIEVRIGLREHDRRAAAELYYDAFAQKLQAMLVSRPRGVRVLTKTINPRFMAVARQHDRLVGILGMDHRGQRSICPRVSTYVDEYGWIGGPIRYLAAGALHQRQHQGEILVVGLAVCADLRGRGIGTLLLEMVFRYARSYGYRAIRLDVVDTNPRARQLYERLGFVPIKTQEFPCLRRFAGCSATTTMVKRIHAGREWLYPVSTASRFAVREPS